MVARCGDERYLGLCHGYVPALAYGSCRVSDQGTTLRASDVHNHSLPIPLSHNDVYMTCVSENSVVFGLDESLSPVRCQTIT